MKKKIISLLLTNIIGATIIFNSNISCETSNTSLEEINKFPDNYISPFFINLYFMYYGDISPYFIYI